jgi:hypothetical protein
MTAAGHHNSRKNVRRDQVSQEGPALATFLFDGERSVWQKDIFFITDFDSGNIAQLFSDLPWREERTATTRFYRLPNHSPAQDRLPPKREAHTCVHLLLQRMNRAITGNLGEKPIIPCGELQDAISRRKHPTRQSPDWMSAFDPLVIGEKSLIELCANFLRDPLRIGRKR